MGNSIQDYLKKINSNLSFFDTVSIVATTLILLGSTLYISMVFKSSQKPIVYRVATGGQGGREGDARPFGSQSGATYTYAWCRGSNVIKTENKIYFADAAAAERSGRTLSKLCQK